MKHIPVIFFNACIKEKLNGNFIRSASMTSIPFKGMVAMLDVDLIKITKHKIYLNSLIYDAFKFLK
jgi:hypothetical protein